MGEAARGKGLTEKPHRLHNRGGDLKKSGDLLMISGRLAEGKGSASEQSEGCKREGRASRKGPGIGCLGQSVER